MDAGTQTFDSTGLYVIRLSSTTRNASWQGRLEHVISGRQHDFDGVEALRDCLRREQILQQVQGPR